MHGTHNLSYVARILLVYDYCWSITVSFVKVKLYYCRVLKYCTHENCIATVTISYINIATGGWFHNVCIYAIHVNPTCTADAYASHAIQTELAVVYNYVLISQFIKDNKFALLVLTIVNLCTAV